MSTDATAVDCCDELLLVETMDIHRAVAENDEGLIKKYVLSGFDLEARDKDYLTPLHVAAAGGQRAVVEFFMKHQTGVNLVDLKSRIGHTPLHLACRFGHLPVVLLLLAEGAQLNSRDSDDNTPLHKAASNGKSHLCRELVKRGADVDARNITEYTPLHWACFKGHKSAAEQLLKCGANINATSSRGATALFMCAYYGHVDVSFLLLAWGADSNIGNEDGVKPGETFLPEVSHIQRSQTRVLFSERQALLMKGYEATRRNMALLYMRSERGDLSLRTSQGEVENLWGKLTKREKELNLSKVGARDLSKAVKAMKVALEHTRQDSKIARERQAALEADVRDAREDTAVQRARARRAERALAELRERVLVAGGLEGVDLSAGVGGEDEVLSKKGRARREGQGKGQSSSEITAATAAAAAAGHSLAGVPTNDGSNAGTPGARSEAAGLAPLQGKIAAHFLRSASFSSSETGSGSQSSRCTTPTARKARHSTHRAGASRPVPAFSIVSGGAPAPILVPSLPTGRIAALASAINTRVAEQGPTAAVPLPPAVTGGSGKTIRRSGSLASVHSASTPVSRTACSPGLSGGWARASGWSRRSYSRGDSGGDDGCGTSASSIFATMNRKTGSSTEAAGESGARREEGPASGGGNGGVGKGGREERPGAAGGEVRGALSGIAVGSAFPADDQEGEAAAAAAGARTRARAGGGQGSPGGATLAPLVGLGKEHELMDSGEDGQSSTDSEKTVPASPETIAARIDGGRRAHSGGGGGGRGGRD